MDISYSYMGPIGSRVNTTNLSMNKAQTLDS